MYEDNGNDIPHDFQPLPRLARTQSLPRLDLSIASFASGSEPSIPTPELLSPEASYFASRKREYCEERYSGTKRRRRSPAAPRRPHPDSFLRRRVKPLRDPFKFDEKEELEMRWRSTGPIWRLNRRLRRGNASENLAAEQARGSEEGPRSADVADSLLQQVERLQGYVNLGDVEAEGEGTEKQVAAPESRGLSQAEQNTRDTMALLAHGMPAEEQAMAELWEVLVGARSECEPPASRRRHYRAQAARRRKERSESAEPGQRCGPGDGSATEGENRSAENVDAFMRTADIALEGKCGFDPGEVDEAPRRSVRDTDVDPAQPASSTAPREEAERQLKNLYFHSGKALDAFGRFRAAEQDIEAAEKRVEWQTLQAHIAGESMRAAHGFMPSPDPLGIIC